MRQLVNLVLLAIITASIAGCAAIERRKQQETLDDTLRIYGNAIRWGQFGLAEKFLAPPEDGLPPGTLPDMEGVKVTAYEVREKTISENGEHAVVVARIQFVHRDRASVYTVMDQQQWQFDAPAKRWLLRGGLPNFDAAMRK